MTIDIYILGALAASAGVSLVIACAALHVTSSAGRAARAPAPPPYDGDARLALMSALASHLGGRVEWVPIPEGDPEAGRGPVFRSRREAEGALGGAPGSRVMARLVIERTYCT